MKVLSKTHTNFGRESNKRESPRLQIEKERDLQREGEREREKAEKEAAATIESQSGASLPSF